jgi:hypothetical protein
VELVKFSSLAGVNSLQARLLFPVIVSQATESVNFSKIW